jgi:hypothetical protein
MLLNPGGRARGGPIALRTCRFLSVAILTTDTPNTMKPHDVWRAGAGGVRGYAAREATALHNYQLGLFKKKGLS